jgi:hypothetical protein
MSRCSVWFWASLRGSSNCGSAAKDAAVSAAGAALWSARPRFYWKRQQSISSEEGERPAVRRSLGLSLKLNLLPIAGQDFEQLQTHIPELDDVERLKAAQAQPNPEAQRAIRRLQLRRGRALLGLPIGRRRRPEPPPPGF